MTSSADSAPRILPCGLNLPLSLSSSCKSKHHNCSLLDIVTPNFSIGVLHLLLHAASYGTSSNNSRLHQAAQGHVEHCSSTKRHGVGTAGIDWESKQPFFSTLMIAAQGCQWKCFRRPSTSSRKFGKFLPQGSKSCFSLCLPWSLLCSQKLWRRGCQTERLCPLNLLAPSSVSLLSFPVRDHGGAQMLRPLGSDTRGLGQASNCVLFWTPHCVVPVQDTAK